MQVKTSRVVSKMVGCSNTIRIWFSRARSWQFAQSRRRARIFTSTKLTPIASPGSQRRFGKQQQRDICDHSTCRFIGHRRSMLQEKILPPSKSSKANPPSRGRSRHIRRDSRFVFHNPRNPDLALTWLQKAGVTRDCITVS